MVEYDNIFSETLERIAIFDFIADFFISLWPARKKPSIGKRILPLRYKNNASSVVVANYLVWVSVVAVIFTFVLILS